MAEVKELPKRSVLPSGTERPTCKWITLKGTPCQNFALYPAMGGDPNVPTCCGIRQHRFYCAQREEIIKKRFKKSDDKNIQALTDKLVEMERQLGALRKLIREINAADVEAKKKGNAPVPP